MHIKQYRIIFLVLAVTLSLNMKMYSQPVPYISPGIQLGYGIGNGFFLCGQITLGIVGDFKDYPTLTTIIYPGITLGGRKYFGSEKKLMRYLDFQISTVGGTCGFGIGPMQIKSINSNNWIIGKRFKLWVGLFGYLTYDIIEISGNNKQHNLGLIGVIPYFDIEAVYP